ncbi:MAG: hypothetical protein AAGD00_04300 [Planctomycetota bacterium]
MTQRHTPTIAAGSAIVILGSVLLAGPLNPPAGPVQPTGRTLELINPRTPLGSSIAGTSAGAQAITSPGAYYLTGNVVVSGSTGITISAHDVVLDLNGYSVLDLPSEVPRLTSRWTGLRGQVSSQCVPPYGTRDV